MFRRLASPTLPLPDVTVIIPTYNSERYIDIVLRYYAEELRLQLMVFVDSKTSDQTMRVAKRFVAEIIQTPNPYTRVEGNIEAILRSCSTKWILRFDDDELPSVGLLNFVRGVTIADEHDAYSFPRHECAISHEGRLIRHTGYDAFEHQQWRLFQPARVRYTKRGHTPGFEMDGLRSATAPLEACMIHLDWAVHSYERRKSKVERYDADTEGDGSKWRAFYLYEEDPQFQRHFTHADFPEFARTAGRLRRRFSELCVTPAS